MGSEWPVSGRLCNISRGCSQAACSRAATMQVSGLAPQGSSQPSMQLPGALRRVNSDHHPTIIPLLGSELHPTGSPRNLSSGCSQGSPLSPQTHRGNLIHSVAYLIPLSLCAQWLRVKAKEILAQPSSSVPEYPGQVFTFCLNLV